MANAICPGCSSCESEVFFSMKGLPVHGTVVCETPELARSVPVGDQILAVCRECGFVFNTVFDPALLDYSGAHEESQIHSPTFVAFASALAKEWIERWRLSGASVVEIGCGGHGDFLHILVQAGVGHAHGIDPSVGPGAARGCSRITVERAEFAPSTRTQGANAIICRHTLEHLSDVSKFLSDVVAGIDLQNCKALLFEVPDFDNVLATGAFWDLHYEHCSNFSGVSLANLFSRAGCSVVALRRVYRGQYLVIEADPDLNRTPSCEAVESGTVEELVRKCREFATSTNVKLEQLRGRLQESADSGREIVVWGGGAKGSVLLNMIKDSGVTRVVDINPGLQGHFLAGSGLPIVSPRSLQTTPPWGVMLMNPIYVEEVRRTLDGLGLDHVNLLTV